MSETTEIRVRFPPSPTGLCHVGTARMAVLNFLFARKHGGRIIYRSEDTDKERSRPEYEADIMDSISWIGLGWDEFYRQSERTEIYRAALKRLVDDDKAYFSEEESKKDAGTMVRVIRLRNPGTIVTFTDIIRGDITFDTTELGDFVIARAEDDPVYHFAVVVDDADMRISHVIRGEEHISNTPRQILIQQALAYPRPQYAHYPLHLGADKSKLSKRKGDVSVKSYRDKGYLPEALLNYIAVLGWTPPSGKEFLSLSEMIAEFELSDLHKSGAVFDIEKLNWFNRHYLHLMRQDDFEMEALRILEGTSTSRETGWDENIARLLMPLIRERISVWEDLRTLIAQGEFDYFFADPVVETAKLPSKNESTEDVRKHLSYVREQFAGFDQETLADPEKIKASLWDYATEHGRGNVLWPLRFALTGADKSPDPFIVASIIGRDTVLRRIDKALQSL